MRSLAEVQEDITQAQSTNQDFESVIEPLYNERHEVIVHNRKKFEDKNYTVKIDCPFHITHKATLFTHGHTCAGYWECEAGNSDVCPHYDTEVEVGEDYEGNKSRLYVCVKCGVEVQGDPDEEGDDR